MAQEKEKIFANGIFTEVKDFKDWQVTNQSFKVDDFIAFLQANKNAQGYVRTITKKGKNGKYFTELNTYVAPASSNNSGRGDDDLPF